MQRQPSRRIPPPATISPRERPARPIDDRIRGRRGCSAFAGLLLAIAPGIAQEQPRPEVRASDQQRPIAPPSSSPSEDELRGYFAKELSKEYLRRAPWATEFEVALRSAAERKDLVFTFFTRSYAHCASCEAVERGLFATEEFLAWAESHVLLAHVTTRLADRPHDELHGQLGFGGFPAFAFLAADGTVLARADAGAGKELASFAKLEERAHAHAALRERARGGDARVRAECFLADLELGNVPLEQARTLLDANAASLVAESRAQALDTIREREFTAALAGIRRQRLPPEQQRAAEAELCERVHTAGEIARRDLSRVLFACADAAEQARDASRLQSLIDELAPIAAELPRGLQILTRLRETLARVRTQPGHAVEAAGEPRRDD
jgi:hypothetical protein